VSADLPPLLAQRRARAIATLQAEYAGTLSADTIARFVIDTFDELLARATVPNYLPLLGERMATQRLRALDVLHIDPSRRVPQVLFVCQHNAGRSQLAAALTAAYAGDRIGVWSAGHMPAEAIQPNVAFALRELGLDLRDVFAKPLLDEVVAAADVVVTMGCGDACPIHSGKRYEDWPIPDPAGLDLAGIRHVRYEIANRVLALLAELIPDLQPRPLPLS
jgi:protein-tyrosine-phosphatase